MNLTLLLDLDDTLLQNDINSFLPHYLDAFAKEAAPYVAPEKFVRLLLAGTHEMVQNRQPDCMLQEAFEATFFPALGVSAGEFRKVADHFYADIFGGLKDLTRPMPGAVEFVQEAYKHGWRIAIATNPLFPRTAVQQRLGWAGLPVDKYAFDLVASYEIFHFVKPEPAFFAEVMADLGWPSGPVLVVGDDLERDIAAGGRLGLPTYWVPPPGVAAHNSAIAPEGTFGPLASGPLTSLLPWLESIDLEKLTPDFSSPSAITPILRSTPAALDTLCRGLPAAAWKTPPKEGEWSLAEILCHLRDVEREVNLPRLQKVLDETNPFIPGQDTDRWAEERGYFHQDGVQALRAFFATRMQMLELLESLSPQAWQRTARHAIFGPSRLQELMNIVAAHDRLHVQQAQQTMAQVL
jgi:FMN phosphatase YigB (HAD superfamily)